MTILVTGANGMIGSKLVNGLLEAENTVIGIDRSGEDSYSENLYFYKTDLTDRKRLKAIIDRHQVDRIIHLAALAHTEGEEDLSWERYKSINVDCAENVFSAAGERPVLFISTIDVYGFFDGKKPVNSETPLHPVSSYAKSKAMAEAECRKLKRYTIFRLSPVYTDTIKRDIQKRYYLKYPNIAYRIGKGTGYEVLNIKLAVAAMVNWCNEEPGNDIRILKDEKLLWTSDCLKAEKTAGRARFIFYCPQWAVNLGYVVLKRILGENEKTYLLNKAVHPLRSED